MLTLASTMTGGFSWEALKAINAGMPEAELLDLLEDALSAQLIAERKGEGAGTYDFTHALIRQTLYDELSTPRRVLLHRQIGEALERLYAPNIDAHLPELAHHFYQAAPGGDVERAIDYARRAGDRATELLAHEEAAGHYERALQALELSGGADPRLKYEISSALALAYWRADVPDRSVPAAEQAFALAESFSSPEILGEAALLYANCIGRGPLALSEIAVPALERALSALGGRRNVLRARLLGRLADSQVSSPRDERLRLAQEAREIAAELGDDHALAAVLDALHGALTQYGPALTEERLSVTDEWLAAAQRSGDRAQVLFARLFHVSALAELGQMAAVNDELPLIWGLADAMREPAFSGWRPMWGAMQALLEGRYGDAEPLVLQALPVAQRTQHPFYLQSVAGLFYDLRRGQGRLEELESIVLQNAADNPTVPVWKAAAAFLYTDSGRTEEARAWLERIVANDLTDLNEDFLYIAVLDLTSDVVRRLGDQPRAALLYERLQPYAERNIVVGNCVLVLGSASRPLGQLASAMGRWDDAVRHFEYALTFDARIGARPWLARTQYEYARMLHERGGPGDEAHASALLTKALATFDELGMKKDVERALALKLELQGATASGIYTSIEAVAYAAREERPALPPQALAPDGTVTIMFSDIEDSTVLTERLGDQAWQELLRTHNALIREQLRAYGGFEVKTMGDGFMVAFQSAKKGLDCALPPGAHQSADRAARGGGDQGRGRLLRQERHPRLARRGQSRRRRDPRVITAAPARREQRRRRHVPRAARGGVEGADGSARSVCGGLGACLKTTIASACPQLVWLAVSA